MATVAGIAGLLRYHGYEAETCSNKYATCQVINPSNACVRAQNGSGRVFMYGCMFSRQTDWLIIELIIRVLKQLGTGTSWNQLESWLRLKVVCITDHLACSYTADTSPI